MRSLTVRFFAAILLLVPALASAAGIVVPTGDVRVIVEFRDPPLYSSAGRAKSGTSTEALRALDARLAQFAADLPRIATTEVQITHTFERVFAGASVTVPAASVQRIEQLPYVARVVLDGTKRALLDDSVNLIEANQVWSSYGTKGRGVVVAVIDTGIDYRHPALGGVFGSRGRVIGGYDFVNRDGDPMDDNGHGTHVAGSSARTEVGSSVWLPRSAFARTKFWGPTVQAATRM